MNYLDRKYDKFLNEKSYEILKSNKDYINAVSKTESVNRELSTLLGKISDLVKQYDDCITEIGCVVAREYYKQGFKSK